MHPERAVHHHGQRLFVGQDRLPDDLPGQSLHCGLPRVVQPLGALPVRSRPVPGGPVLHGPVDRGLVQPGLLADGPVQAGSVQPGLVPLAGQLGAAGPQHGGHRQHGFRVLRGTQFRRG